MARLPEYGQQFGVFHQMAGIHYAYAPRHIRHYAHIVGYHQYRRFGIAAQLLQAFQYFGL